MSDFLKKEREGQILYLTLSRPEKLNALNRELLEKLYRTYIDLESDDEIRLIIINGSEKAFSAGADLDDLTNFDIREAQEYIDLGQLAMQKVARAKQVTIASVDGYALGGGFELALACDFTIASESATFGLPESDYGLIPAFGGALRLPLRIHHKKALEMIMLGERVNGKKAMEMGLIDRLVSEGELKAETERFAKEILKRPRLGIRSAKRALLPPPFTEEFTIRRDLFLRCLFSEETKRLLDERRHGSK